MMPDKARAFVRRAQRAYPDPVPIYAIKRPATGAYCVGGAVGRMALPIFSWLHAIWYSFKNDASLTFPYAEQLAQVLQKLNQDLTKDVATNSALEIIELNDDKKFDRAWRVVERALAYPLRPLPSILDDPEDCRREDSRQIQSVCS